MADALLRHQINFDTTDITVFSKRTNTVVHVEIHSRGAIVRHYDSPLVSMDRDSKFKIPQELGIGSSTFNAASFDADVPQKKSKRFAKNP